ncbi:hypothetical protein [Candidatus Odyssella acanthamoebae]|uniref:hypothetical protein n=1 Tax=Candidatus Odyssella acanthamoebae TaxID=91604 RepID=UPI0012EB4AC5|nr:hypothetical protein [Candidatus Paracaedibacter acanthamoebae]
MIDYIKNQFKDISTWKGMVALGAAIIMYFTPDEIDNIIIMALGTLGITDIFVMNKK